MLDETQAFGSPATAYALFEDRLRVAAGEGVEEHRRRIAELWARFNAVAVENEMAWDRTRLSAAQIAEPSSDNRMISFPYTKAMVANNTVDMASALLLCSTDAAATAGVPADRLVYPHVIASAHETWQVINRHRLDHLPALERAGHVAFDAAGIEPLDVDHVDLYACFPSIVQLSCAALGFSTDRPLTMTGGLGFAGAPVANAAGQSLAAIVPAVRRGGWGFVHANGGFATKHSCGIYANHPPERFVNVECGTTEDWRDAGPDGPGTAVVEAATVAFDRDGPVACRRRPAQRRRTAGVGVDERCRRHRRGDERRPRRRADDAHRCGRAAAMTRHDAVARTVRLVGDGLTLAADERGDPGDPAIVLLHGGGQTRHAWGSAATTFARRGWHTVAVDLRGHGDSDWAADGDYDLGAFAGDVRAVAASLPRRPALVGASLGGLASLIAVGEATEPAADALVLVDVTPSVVLDGAQRIRDFMAGGLEGFDRLEDAAALISAYLPHRPPPADLSGLRKNLRQRDGRWYWHWDPRFMTSRSGIDGQRGLVDHDRLAAAARRVAVPTLLVRGGMSDIVSEEGVSEFRRLVPHAEVVDVAGAGHMVAGDRNDAFNDAVIDFVERHARNP